MKYATPAALEMAVKAAAKKSPLNTSRAISSYYFHRLLCRIFSDSNSPFVLKGGQSVLARTIDARVTRDIDLLTTEETLSVALKELERLAKVDLDDFLVFRLSKAEPIKTEDEYRDGIKVCFAVTQGPKQLQPVSIDLVIDEVQRLEPENITPVDRLAIEGLPVFDYRVYRAECALADKLLAIIETHNGRPSSRVKDLIDIVVYAKTCEIDGKTLSSQVSKESKARKVELPKCFFVPNSWIENYEKPFEKMAAQAKIVDVAPNFESAVELADKLYEPALTSTNQNALWSPHALKWLSAEETRFLTGIPKMAESLVAGVAEPLSECVTENNLDW